MNTIHDCCAAPVLEYILYMFQMLYSDYVIYCMCKMCVNCHLFAMFVEIKVITILMSNWVLFILPNAHFREEIAQIDHLYKILTFGTVHQCHPLTSK